MRVLARFNARRWGQCASVVVAICATAAAHAAGPGFSAVLGGSGQDYAAAAASDPAGNTYIAGLTYSPDFRVTKDAWTNNAIASRMPGYAAVGDPSAPARPGDTIALWGTGFGATDPAVAAGPTVRGAPAVVTAPTVTVGGAPAQVVGTILTVGSAGLYQVTIQVPANAPLGAVEVQASVGGVQTPANVTIFIGKP